MISHTAPNQLLFPPLFAPSRCSCSHQGRPGRLRSKQQSRAESCIRDLRLCRKARLLVHVCAISYCQYVPSRASGTCAWATERGCLCAHMHYVQAGTAAKNPCSEQHADTKTVEDVVVRWQRLKVSWHRFMTQSLDSTSPRAAHHGSCSVLRSA